ncbi:MAG: Gfo/Idh/MocA family oxidoreductase, partial [Candidatus Hydrogenedentes bacterium]|nr:Gfo/Idh/MocA family oxidoreductase [Candidatus Hydrogenedentota bacterium]
MDRKTVRSGLAGAGFAANFHYESVMRVHGVNVEVQGVYSPMPDGAAFAEARGIKSFGSLDEMLDVVDIVHVCAPPSTHEKIAVAALERDKSVIVEKPFTGYFGDGSDEFDGDTFPRQDALDNALASIDRMLAAESKSQGRICYAENWVYAPSVQKEREIIEKTGAQILWVHGEESHSGSHSATYGIWKFSGGGSLMGKGCHPLTAALYLKRVEGRARNGTPIRPKSVTCRLHSITRLPGYEDKGHIRTDYKDVEDFSMTHITFDDGTVADVFSTELVLGGVHNWLEVAANNHRTICNINP